MSSATKVKFKGRRLKAEVQPRVAPNRRAKRTSHAAALRRRFEQVNSN